MKAKITTRLLWAVAVAALCWTVIGATRFGNNIAVASFMGSVEKNLYNEFRPGTAWHDTDGNIINAHGGGILVQDGRYYWFGEKRGRQASQGVNVYSSTDLYHWKHEGLALAPVTNDEQHDIAEGCKMERPKVLFNKKTGKYVMWFHLELRGKGYEAARAAVAVSDAVAGPYTYLHSFRPNGHMSRDMTLYQDDDGKAYHIYAARDNYDLRIAQLTDDYLHATTRDSLLFSEHREAPALMKYRDKYYLITSGCTGWKPNAASLHVAERLWGPWQRHENPLRGNDAHITFDGQSTFLLPVTGREGAYIFMADRWTPSDLRNSAYLWLPVTFEKDLPVIAWRDTWHLDFFK